MAHRETFMVTNGADEGVVLQGAGLAATGDLKAVLNVRGRLVALSADRSSCISFSAATRPPPTKQEVA